MEIASPLIDKFLPGDILSRISESELNAENRTLGLLCFYSAFNCFVKNNLFSELVDPDSKHGQIQSHISAFLAGDDRLLFDSLHVLLEPEGYTILSLSGIASERLVGIGSLCCNKALYPFAVNKPKHPDFIVAVASSFQRVLQRMHPMWQADGYVPVSTLLVKEIVQFSGDGQWELCASLSLLALEVVCINVYRLQYSLLSDTDKADAGHYATRAMFWCASFFYDMLRRGWDKEDDLNAWIDTTLDMYMLKNNETSRGVYLERVNAVVNRVLVKQETLTQLHRFLQTFNPPRDETVLKLMHDAAWLEAMAVEAIDMSEEDIDTFREYTQFISITVELLEAECTDVAPSAIVTPPAATAPPLPGIAAAVAQAFGEEVDHHDVLWGEEEDDTIASPDRRKRKKKSRNQRQRIAREKHMAELALILGDVCDQVANEIAAEAAEEQRRWMAERSLLDERAANYRIQRTIEIRKERERVAAAHRAQQTVLDQMRAGVLPTSFVLELLDGLLPAEEIVQRACVDVLWQMRTRRLPGAFLLELMQCAFPAMENLLESAQLECFVCMQPVDMRHLGVGYLVCCDGGSFACSDCIDTHATSDRHPMRVERRIVDLAACVRNGLRLGEFAMPVGERVWNGGAVAQEIAERARSEVMERLRMGTLPDTFLQDLVRSEFPTMEHMLDPTMRCSACMQPMSLRTPGVGYLVCCERGSFACPRCIQSHGVAHRQAPRVEYQIVALAASVRRHLRVGEFA